MTMAWIRALGLIALWACDRGAALSVPASPGPTLSATTTDPSTAPPAVEGRAAPVSSGLRPLRLPASDAFARAPSGVGHYSSADGHLGFVLDRTGPRALLRVDGSTEILELEADTSSAQYTDLDVRGRGTVVRIGRHGEVTYFPGLGAASMHRDADADPLRSTGR